jgi:BolA protein
MLKRCFSVVKDLLHLKAQEFNPSHLEIIDESWMYESSKETHFRVLIVSSKFEGQSLTKRTYSVYKSLEDSLNLDLTHLVIWAKTPQEYEAYNSNHFIFDYPSH